MKQLARVIPFAIVIACAACGKSDESVTADLRSQLSAAKVDASQVSIETKGPLITLSGMVTSTVEREEITRIVRQASGGKDVLDKMTVREAPAAAIAPAPRAPASGPVVETAVATAPAESSGSTLGKAASATGSAVATGAKATGNAVVDASKATGNAAVKGAEATASGAKKLGSGVAGVFGGGKDEKSDKK